MRTQARTAGFMPGESPPDVMIAIFFLAVILDVDGFVTGELEAGGFGRGRGAWMRMLIGMEKRTMASRAWKWDAMAEKG